MAVTPQGGGTSDSVRGSFYQYYIHGGGELDTTSDTAGNLLDRLNDRQIRVNCGCHTAPVAVMAYALSGPPPEDQADWDLVAEVDVTTTGELVVFHGDLVAPAPALGNLAVAGAGLYRLRCSARGRDAARQHHVLSTPVEHHLLQAWPIAT